MKKFSLWLVSGVVLGLSQSAVGLPRDQAIAYCDDPGLSCITVQKGMTWDTLFPDPIMQDIAKRLNRMNTRLKIGSLLVVPNSAAISNAGNVAPFHQTIVPPGEKLLVFDPAILAWGAYNAEGKLVHWGPASPGKSWCPDIGKSCRTVTGDFRVYAKGGAGCKSSKYPVPNGGAPMPYCMFFHGGFAFHASTDVPGYAASHGCVRIFLEDAKWLNEEFIDAGSGGTRVIIRPNLPVSVGV